ncbi:MAG: PKD domain-containing protein [Thermoguttaceae bacterium]|nr:PKD domain-containing protein [Thermoguttaceae bacterium]MDW8078178.1 PKD domain-containing protein [Thermoguttaceae bacterium]
MFPLQDEVTRYSAMLKRRSHPGLIALFFLVAVLVREHAAAQSFRCAGTEFNAQRPVRVPPDRSFSVVVVEFFHHGEIQPDGKNVLVATERLRPVPTRVLQVGPGDFCRLAFQTVPQEESYVILYGGQPPDPAALPPWTSRDGLLFEARKFPADVNLFSFDSVKKAFEQAEPIGADYVDGVLHGFNPVWPRPEPFLSRYSGYLHISTPGVYGFYTSSEDCSFLVIDDKLVVEAPGRHRPERFAQPGMRRDIRLEAGPHRFEYYHAAAGPSATMVAAWEPNPSGAKPQPQAIPPEVFRSWAVGRLTPGPPSSRREKLMPDFTFEATGDVPLPDNPDPLVGVEFTNTSPPELLTRVKVHWDFGDGQTSEELNPFHVYLRPGLYTVKLTVTRAGRPVEIAHRILVDQPIYNIPRRRAQAQKGEQSFPTIDQYLPILSQYNPKKLDAVSLRQLVLAYEYKATLLLGGEEPPQPGAGKTPQDVASTPEELARRKKELAAKRTEAAKWIQAAVAAGQVAFAGQAAARGDAELLALARLVGPMARDYLGDSKAALAIWLGAAERLTSPEAVAEAQTEAADILVNDLTSPKEAASLLESAQKKLGTVNRGNLAAKLARVWADYHAALGQADEARRLYRQAEERLQNPRTYVERIAWQGAHSRSVEDFLQVDWWERAAEQLRNWEAEFPADKIEGYWGYLKTRYWLARNQLGPARQVVEQLLTINPTSPYADLALFALAEAEVTRGLRDQALAHLQQLIRDYPGSPTIPQAKALLSKLEQSTKR